MKNIQRKTQVWKNQEVNGSNKIHKLNSLNQIKNTFNEVNNTLDTEQKNISEVEVRTTETMLNVIAQREKRQKMNWQGLMNCGII